jgi:SAM-dependent methyltransferase
LDIGSGIPTEGNVHEVAQAAAPRTRVVYVDTDPVAVAHSRAILAGNQRADVVQADLSDVAAILDDPRTRRLIDPTQPIGVLMVAILHSVPDEADPANIVAQYRQTMAPGSYLVVSHASHGGRPELFEPITKLYQHTAAPFTMRSRRSKHVSPRGEPGSWPRPSDGCGIHRHAGAGAARRQGL